MQNHTQITLIQRWERDNWTLGNVYKNRLAKKPIEVVRNELENLKQLANGVSFSVVPKGKKIIDSDKVMTFKKG